MGDGGGVLAGAERVLVGTAVAVEGSVVVGVDGSVVVGVDGSVVVGVDGSVVVGVDGSVVVGVAGSVGDGLGVDDVSVGSGGPVGDGTGDGLGGGAAGGVLRVGRGAGGAETTRRVGTRSSTLGPYHESSGTRRGAAGSQSAVAVGPALGVSGVGSTGGG
ncbi:hypothetical protein [Micromonospora sp. NPDC005174]|uniref:hypothetical protein n=1 Tax=Micromonospora sp. NPDC005174 TaxID=3157018 RepID=UPI0033AC9C94